MTVYDLESPYLFHSGSDFDLPECPDIPRRWKIVHCDPQLFLMLLNWCRNPMKIVGLPNPKNPIPYDCDVISVNACWERRSIDVIISHSSFDIVPAGARIPDFCDEWIPEQLFSVENGVLTLNGELT